MSLIPNSVTRKVGRSILTTKKNSPHIFFVAGIAGTIVSTVLACRATLKLEETLDEIKEDLTSVKQLKEERLPDSNYPENAYLRDLGYVYGKSASKMVRLYGPSVVIGGVSIACLTGSHIQLTRRNTALTMTLAAVSKAFDEYRQRVRDELGEERELELHRAVHDEPIEGSKQVEKVIDASGVSVYARFFDECSDQWTKDPEHNRIFLQCQQNYFNHRLNAKGHVFLNEVYDALGLERSRAGQVVGWVSNGDGDGYIDFGLFEARSNRFVNNMERTILLDFNVDGVIYDKI